MVASSEQCRRHVSAAAWAIPSFSDDGVVQTILKELENVHTARRTEKKPPLVSLQLRCLRFYVSGSNAAGSMDFPGDAANRMELCR